MQIRVANRQDEPIIRTIVSQANAEIGGTEVDLTGRDSDLNNIDANYFWYDGIFLVAEEDGQIIGLAGARRGESEIMLELMRLVVIPARRRRKVASRLMETISFFGNNLGYREVVYKPSQHGTAQREPILGFTADGARWKREIARATAHCSNPS